MFGINRESVKNFFANKGPYIGMALVVIVVLGFFAWRNYKGNDIHQHTTYPDTFFVTSLDFVNQLLTINFSQPVDPAMVKDSFVLSPNVNGSFSQGNSETEVVFVPEFPLQTGTEYTATIYSGLTSKIGGKLQEDFVKTISLRFSADDYKILKNGRYSLLQSISSYNPDVLRAQVGGNIKYASLKVFKSTDAEGVIKDILSYTAAPGNWEKPNFATDISKLTLVNTVNEVKQNMPVQLPKEPGLYLVQALGGEKGEIISQTWFSVNTFGVHFRQDDQKVVVAAQDLSTGEPVSGLEMKTYSTNDQNQFPAAYPNEVAIATVRRGAEFAFIPVRIVGSLAELNSYQNLSDSWQGFLYTERPIYRSNDTIKFRGIVRKDNDALYQLPQAGTRISLTTNGDKENSTLPTQEVFLDANGAFYGEMNLSNVPAGFYTMYANITGDNNGYMQGGYAWFEVKDYVKPDFELKAKIEKEDYIEGEAVNVNLKGSTFTGQAFGAQKVKYTVYAQNFYETEKTVYNESFLLNGWGGMCGGGFDPYSVYYGEPVESREVTLGGDGQLNVSFDSKKLTQNVSQTVTVVLEKTDKNNNVVTDAQTTIVHNGEMNIFLRSFKRQITDKEEPTATFSAETLSGEKIANREFEYKIEQVIYGYDEATQKSTREAKIMSTGKTTTNAEGRGEFKITGLKDYNAYDTFEVSVQGRDARGNLITSAQPMYVYQWDYENELPTLLDISSTQLNLVPGNRAQLKINSPANVKVFLAFERGRIYDPQWLDLKAGENTFEFPVKNEYRPSIAPTFSAFHNNTYYSEGLTFNVPAMDKVMTITATTDKAEYQAGEVAKISIKATTANGAPAETSLSLGIIDKAIFSLRKSTQLPLHSSFYYFRPRRTNNSSTMTGISFGQSAEQGGGGGDTNPFSARDVDVLYWNPDLKTDASGQLTIFVPVIGNTIWKGVIYGATSATDLGQTDFEFSSR